jgi:hypothetical protein
MLLLHTIEEFFSTCWDYWSATEVMDNHLYICINYEIHSLAREGIFWHQLWHWYKYISISSQTFYDTFNPHCIPSSVLFFLFAYCSLDISHLQYRCCFHIITHMYCIYISSLFQMARPIHTVAKLDHYIFVQLRQDVWSTDLNYTTSPSC